MNSAPKHCPEMHVYRVRPSGSPFPHSHRRPPSSFPHSRETRVRDDLGFSVLAYKPRANARLPAIGSTPPSRRLQPTSSRSQSPSALPRSSASFRNHRQQLRSLSPSSGDLVYSSGQLPINTSVGGMATSSSYPPPPPFYRLYGDYLGDPKSGPEPPPPVQGTYPLFGATYSTEDELPSLEDQGVRQLYPKGPNIDYKKELRALNRELQLHLLELADVLVERPSQYARRVEDISLIFKNLHHLLNSLRPHQARATLIHILELQIQRRKQVIEDVKRRREEAQTLLRESLQILDGHSA